MFDLNKLVFQNLFDWSKSPVPFYEKDRDKPWQLLDQMDQLHQDLIAHLDLQDYRLWPNFEPITEDLLKVLDLKDQIIIHKTCRFEGSVHFIGPVILMPNIICRQGLFLRGNVIVGASSILGNSVEIKNSLLFNSVEACHYNYIGDSILGYKAHLGAAAILSNVRADKKNIFVGGKCYGLSTQRQKLGALVGDEAEIGASAVLNPGSVIGRSAQVYPLSNFRNYLKESHIYKTDGSIIQKY